LSDWSNWSTWTALILSDWSDWILSGLSGLSGLSLLSATLVHADQAEDEENAADHFYGLRVVKGAEEDGRDRSWLRKRMAGIVDYGQGW
jgi:hypothetical protein